MICLICANFIAFGVIIFILLKKINNTDLGNVDIDRDKDSKSLGEMLMNPNYYLVLVSSFIIVGSCTAYHLEAPSVAYAMGKPELGPKVMKEFWICDVILRFCGGIAVGLFTQILNPYLCLSVSGFLSMLGFGISLLSQPVAPMFFYASSFLIGSSVGGFWVIIPQIILIEGGKKSFGVLWGVILFINVLGVFCFDKFFMKIDGKEEPYEIGFCQGYSCYLISFITSSILSGFAGCLCFLCYFNSLNSSNSEDKSSSSKDKDKKNKNPQ